MYPRFDVCLYIKAFTYKPVKTYVNPPLSTMEPRTLEQEAIVKFLGSSRSQEEWDNRVETLLTIHFQSKIPPFWIDLVIKSNLYFRTKQKWVYRKLNSSRK
jgi:hypothetical protein